MTLGLFEKVVLADGFLGPVVDKIYSGDAIPGFIDSWVATLAFSGQIFCDFAGYSVAAVGAALCLGFALSDNFRFPYAAVGFTDFWRRWHITLSAWLRDYVYIPLGGNRHGDVRTYFSLMATMLIGGLWHGASWTFAVWGALHGIYLAVERLLRKKSRVIAQDAQQQRPSGCSLSFLSTSPGSSFGRRPFTRPSWFSAECSAETHTPSPFWPGSTFSPPR